jgi:hypothetical protein
MKNHLKIKERKGFLFVSEGEEVGGVKGGEEEK